jgi:hypothetical protein
MSEEAKIAGVAAVGAVIGLKFIPQSVGAALFSIASSVALALFLAEPLAKWFAAPKDTAEGLLLIGLLIGLFGLPVCDLIFRSLKKSDLSVRLSSLVELIRAWRT